MSSTDLFFSNSETISTLINAINLKFRTSDNKKSVRLTANLMHFTKIYTFLVNVSEFFYHYKSITYNLWLISYENDPFNQSVQKWLS